MIGDRVVYIYITEAATDLARKFSVSTRSYVRCFDGSIWQMKDEDSVDLKNKL